MSVAGEGDSSSSSGDGRVRSARGDGRGSSLPKIGSLQEEKEGGPRLWRGIQSPGMAWTRAPFDGWSCPCMPGDQ